MKRTTLAIIFFFFFVLSSFSLPAQQSKVLLVEITGTIDQSTVEVLTEKFFVITDDKGSRVKDIFILYDNDREKKITIEFTINKGTRTLFVDYFGPYDVGAGEKMLIAQQYDTHDGGKLQ